jgi:hypothetical protein
MKHPIFIFGLTRPITSNIDGRVISKNKVDNVKVEGFEQAQFFAINSIPTQCIGSTIEVQISHIKEESEQPHIESANVMKEEIEKILKSQNKFLKLEICGDGQDETAESELTEEQKKEYLISEIKNIGGKADKRSSVETLEEMLIELRGGGDNGDTE